MRSRLSEKPHFARRFSTRKSGPVVVVTLMLVACGRPAPVDTVDSLISHPGRLHEVEQRCGDDFAKIDVAECNAAAEAQRRLFMGNGRAHYTPPKEAPKF